MQLADIKSLMSSNPRLLRDDYLCLGITIAERFIRRIETGGPDVKQSREWSALQENALKDVLN